MKMFSALQQGEPGEVVPAVYGARTHPAQRLGVPVQRCSGPPVSNIIMIISNMVIIIVITFTG